MKRATLLLTALVAVSMVVSVVALPFLGGGGLFEQTPDDEADDGVEMGGTIDDAEVGQLDESESVVTGAADLEGVSMAAVEPETAAVDAGALAQEDENAVEAGVEEGIELAQAQGVEITQEQQTAALEGASQSAAQYQEAQAEQIQEATKGAVHGSLMQSQAVEAEQVQAAVGGATSGALAQYQTVNASQMQSATWGATHGAMAQHQRVTVEQIQVATVGAAAGAAAEAGEKGVDRAPKIQEAAQGSAYGVLEQYQKITAEQRQQVTLEHVQYAAAGAASGAIEGSTAEALEQDQRLEVEQQQEVTVKQIQKAATGAAKGALVQQQAVSVEQTQAAAHGAGMGPLKQLQTVSVEQVQRISITQVQEASFGSAKGAIAQSQEASIEQIQSAADGAGQGVLVQQQEISVTQIQAAATGAAKGAVETAIQQQIVQVEQIQAAAFGAGEGAVLQQQAVEVTQVQALAEGASSGALSQHQEASIEQIQTAASSACQEAASVIQYQQISVSQVQSLTQAAAGDAVAYAVAEGIDDEAQIVQYVEVEVVQIVEEIDELEGEASISLADQESAGENVTVDSVSLSEGGFVAVYDGVDVGVDPAGVIGHSEYLESGNYEDIQIDLDEPLEESGPIVAAVHHDTTDDQTFQYVDSGGEDDEPYVTQGGTPVLDSAFVTVEDEPDPPAEPEATLSVTDQEGDGETLTVDEANASVEYAIAAEYDGETAEIGPFEANEPVTNETISLEPPIEENTTVDVSVLDAENETELASESIEYALEDEEPDPPAEPEATLSVVDQTGNGSTLAVDQASATVEYGLTVTDEEGAELAASGPYEANETATDETLVLEPPLEENATLDVNVVSAAEVDGVENGAEADDAQTDDGEANGAEPDDETAEFDGDVLETETIEYTVEPDDVPDEFEAEFPTCYQAEMTGSFEDGDRIIVATTFYESGGIGNTLGEYSVTVGEDIEAPLEGTIVFEVGEEFAVTETEEGALVEVPSGNFGATIVGFSSPDAIPGSIDYSNPEAGECVEEVRPELPELDVEETTPTDDGIDVTFGYDNPNGADLIVESELEGTTEDEPPNELAPGSNSFTVDWTPENDDEQLAWVVDMGFYDYDEPVVVETEPAGEIDPDEPAEFSVDILEPIEPVEQGDELTLEVEIANVGGETGAQSIDLEIDGVSDSIELTLGEGDSEIVAFAVDTSDLEPSEYDATVSSEDDSDTATVTIEEAADEEDPVPEDDGVVEDEFDDEPDEADGPSDAESPEEPPAEDEAEPEEPGASPENGDGVEVDGDDGADGDDGTEGEPPEENPILSTVR
ncbi:hypothetical protein [Halostagnicola sp. A-GB9-2]|uniref:DUF7282 domain-containing protein n=1 Tax=Halostagnicola sp. A-GB9-2 TaxID=3048066 RepID=UPI0024BFAC06|nr:hypothetical protein [Halostagnicola sp. A-GB9-2]MDJ1433532.1 hypothetical protein [Halostagnicola sp. A-GB9-2]